MARYFGDEYVGPGSPGYEYHTPGYDIAQTYTDPAYSEPERNYVELPGNSENAPPVYDYATHDYEADGYTAREDAPSGSGGPSVLSQIMGGFFNIFKPAPQQRQLPGRPAAPATPAWVWPVVIGGGVLLLGGGALLLTGGRKSVAGYRKRRKNRR